MDTWLWLVSIASFIGVWLNIRRNRLCFHIWTCTNATWLYVDLMHGIHAQAAVQATYLGLALYGIWSWREKR